MELLRMQAPQHLGCHLRVRLHAQRGGQGTRPPKLAVPSQVRRHLHLRPLPQGVEISLRSPVAAVGCLLGRLLDQGGDLARQEEGASPLEDLLPLGTVHPVWQGPEDQAGEQDDQHEGSRGKVGMAGLQGVGEQGDKGLGGGRKAALRDLLGDLHIDIPEELGVHFRVLCHGSEGGLRSGPATCVVSRGGVGRSTAGCRGGRCRADVLIGRLRLSKVPGASFGVGAEVGEELGAVWAFLVEVRVGGVLAL